MFDDIYFFVREGLSAWSAGRIPHRTSLMFEPEFCEQYARATLVSDFRVLLAFILEQALAGVPLKGDALDVACGPGVLLGEFARQRPGMSFTGLDLSPAMLTYAQSHLQSEGIGNVQLMSGDMGRLTEIFGGRKFDWITWTFGLHYCATSEQALATLNGIAALLKPGGIIFLADLARFKREDTRCWFSGKYDRDHGDRFFQEIQESYSASFTPRELCDLLRQSRLTGTAMEWSRLFPVLLLAHNRGSVKVSQVQTPLPWRQRAKLAALRTLFKTSMM